LPASLPDFDIRGWAIIVLLEQWKLVW